MFFKKLLNSKQCISQSDADKTRKNIERYEEKFKNTNMFIQNVYHMQPKYYLQNKNKEELCDIQEEQRAEINKLNMIYPDNFYFIRLEKNILDKQENKHIYNIFTVSRVEYIKINILDDVIGESDIFYSGDMKPFNYSNLTDYYKEMVYELIDESLNTSEMYISYDENEFKYHNNYLMCLRDVIFNFFVELYSSKPLIELRKLFIDMDSSLSIANTIKMKETMEQFNDTKHKTKLEKILDKIIECKLDIDSNIINHNVLKEIVE